ncbi:uncharacterized protein LACBIDRAFT_304599 [Laccaria bicolor S238N-H82]|uniref:Predicted protein n=1 Tax=Laccaria bicolor (strain S238N-H82 / ATCC MYA-4686) TaxID=486041 RepID=B0DLZ6_LACBS|nr:uncharacterized protein LACBIDRAFT_304599 [Laccaria bicolor S238N-H82]EDR04479.1 predicted protein [Laccaria bicolor S238N-H82]|eukprot:XP_001884998.1 predicted protein [Laccaria bicolor S238N-H82]
MWYHWRTTGSDSNLDSLLKEWKILNGISALLTMVVSALLQIPQAANDHITRETALLLLICALMGLIYGCIYMVIFGTMRSMF